MHFHLTMYFTAGKIALLFIDCLYTTRRRLKSTMLGRCKEDIEYMGTRSLVIHLDAPFLLLFITECYLFYKLHLEVWGLEMTLFCIVLYWIVEDNIFCLVCWFIVWVRYGLWPKNKFLCIIELFLPSYSIFLMNSTLIWV